MILYEKKSNIPCYPASITKISTALYTLYLENDLSKTVVADRESLASMSDEAKKRCNYSVPAYWLVPDGTHIELKLGKS